MITIILLGGAKVYVDLDIDRGRCKACHKTVYWASTSNARKMPICKDDKGNWVSHFSNCTKAAMFRRRADYIPKTNGVETLGNFDERRFPKI